jgi:hypothetical protein
MSKKHVKIVRSATLFYDTPYHVHIGKCLQSVETLECCDRGGVIVSELTTTEVDSVFETQSGQGRHLMLLR